MDGVKTGDLGEVLVRCNNVMYVREGQKTEEDGNQEKEME